MYRICIVYNHLCYARLNTAVRVEVERCFHLSFVSESELKKRTSGTVGIIRTVCWSFSIFAQTAQSGEYLPPMLPLKSPGLSTVFVCEYLGRWSWMKGLLTLSCSCISFARFWLGFFTFRQVRPTKTCRYYLCKWEYFGDEPRISIAISSRVLFPARAVVSQ